jgi:hypothetical protein
VALFVKSAAASIASNPASVTIAIRPSSGVDGGVMKLIWVKREAGIFSKRGWTRPLQGSLTGKSLFADGNAVYEQQVAESRRMNLILERIAASLEKRESGAR